MEKELEITYKKRRNEGKWIRNKKDGREDFVCISDQQACLERSKQKAAPQMSLKNVTAIFLIRTFICKKSFKRFTHSSIHILQNLLFLE